MKGMLPSGIAQVKVQRCQDSVSSGKTVLWHRRKRKEITLVQGWGLNAKLKQCCSKRQGEGTGASGRLSS